MLSIALILFFSWVIPVFLVISNQLNPSYGSALGVAYGFLLGTVIHGLAMIIWVFIHRSAIKPAEMIILSVSMILMVVLLIAGNTGGLSKVN